VRVALFGAYGDGIQEEEEGEGRLMGGGGGTMTGKTIHRHPPLEKSITWKTFSRAIYSIIYTYTKRTHTK
jgi:hypothetical protein